MSKTKSYPSPVSHVAKEARAGGHLLLWAVVAVVVLLVAGPGLLNAGADATVDAIGRTANGAVRNHTYPLPGPAGGWNGPSPGDTTSPTSAAPPPNPQPYGPPNGKIKPLPSELPPVTAPPAEDAPVLSGPSGGGPLGELLAKIPEVGPAIEAGLKAIGPAAP